MKPIEALVILDLDPPFGLDFTRDRTDIFLGNNTDFDVDDDESFSPSTTNRSVTDKTLSSSVTGYRKGGPKEARLKKIAMLSKTKDVDHLHPIKVKNIPETIKSDELAAHFSKFGKVEDVYIPTNLKTGKNRDFAVVRYADPKAVETILSTESILSTDSDSESVGTLKIKDSKITVSPLNKQPVFFSKGTGYLGITNEAFDDGTRSVSSKPPPQDIPLSSCLSRSGAPWGSVHELKVLAPYGSIDALQKHAIKLTNLPTELTADEIKDYFSQYGKVLDVCCPKPLQVNLRPRLPNVGYAFVRFDDKRDLEVALNDINSEKVSFYGHISKGELLLPSYWPTERTRRYY